MHLLFPYLFLDSSLPFPQPFPFPLLLVSPHSFRVWIPRIPAECLKNMHKPTFYPQAQALVVFTPHLFPSH